MKVESLYRKLMREKAQAKFQATGQLPSTTQHGSHQAYVYYGCRCDVCVATHNYYLLEWAKRSPVRHGTMYGYKNQGCRCDLCKSAVRTYFQGYRARKQVAA